MNFPRIIWIALGCFLLLPAEMASADGTADDGLPRPEMGKEWLAKLLSPATALDAVHELALRTEEAESKIEGEGYEPRWKNAPRAVFDACHADLRVTACPDRDCEAALYLISYSNKTGPYDEWRESTELQVPDDRQYPLHPTEIERSARWQREVAEEAERRRVELFRTPPWKPGDPLLDDIVIEFVDPNGKLAWPFEGDNVIESGAIADLNGDGILERFGCNNSGIGHSKGRPRMKVQYLQIQTVEPHPRTLLNVVFNWHPKQADENNRWWYALTDSDHDGSAEVQLGPQPGETEGGPLLKTAVTFRWDQASAGYTGPTGAKSDHFRRTDTHSSMWASLKSLEKEGGLGYPVLSSPPADVDAPVDDSPYVHQSLAGSSDPDLLRFMTAGAPNIKESTKRKEFSWESGFVHPENLEQRPPREAAMALAEANRTDEHRAAFELVMMAAEDERPPERGSMLIEKSGGWSAPRWEAVYFGKDLPGDAANRWLRHDGMQRDHFPDWNSEHRWSRAALSPERAAWLAETSWWLDKIRTVSRTPAEPTPNESFGADDITLYQFHMAGSDGGKPALVFPTTQGYDLGKRWLGHYDRNVAASLAVRLWEASMKTWLGDTPAEKEDAAASTAILERVLPEDGVIPAGQVVQPILSAVQTVGDQGMNSFAARLAKLAAAIPPPDAAEEKLATLSAALQQAKEARKQSSDMDAWKREDLAEYHHNRQLDLMRDHPGFRLRDAVALAERQLQSLGNSALLKGWAKDTEAPGAAWAMAKLNAENQKLPGAIAAEAAKAESEPVERAALVRYLTQQDPARAVKTYWLLSEKERLPLTGTVFKVVPPENQVTPEWRSELIRFALENEGMGFYRRAEALELLVPDDDPMRFADSSVDEALVAFLKSPDPSSRDTPSEIAWVGLTLAQRGDGTRYWDLFVEGYLSHRDSRMGFQRDSLRRPLRHVARTVGGEFSKKYWETLRSEFESGPGGWKGCILDLYVSGARAAESLLTTVATRSPDESEGPNATSKTSAEAAIQGRYHAARHVLAAWKEPDPVTRVKITVLLGALHPGRVYGRNGFSVDDRALDDLRKLAEGFTETERREVTRFIRWCGNGGGDSLQNRQQIAPFLDKAHAIILPNP